MASVLNQRSASQPINWRLRCLRMVASLFALCAAAPLVASPAKPQTAPPAAADFARRAARLTADRTSESPDLRDVQEQALEILDRVVLDQLNTVAPSLELLNHSLAAFVSHQPPVGESYTVVRLGGAQAAYALVADFGVSGPSAVRLYSGEQGQLSLAARVDHYTQPDFLDDYLELIPLPGPDGLFVTVVGRTDDLQTGVFTAWRFSGRAVGAVWTSDILQQSSYEAAADGLGLTYCGDGDAVEGPCKKMVRDLYAWRDGAWKRLSTGPAPAPAPAAAAKGSKP